MVHIALVLTRWMSDVEFHHFCLGDMVELVMVLNVVFKFCAVVTYGDAGQLRYI